MTKFTRWLNRVSINQRFYFAYGSNMNKEQMYIRCPQSKAVAVAKFPGHKFLINSRGVATIIPNKLFSVYGIIWVLSHDDEANLDFHENVKKEIYYKKNINVEIENQQISSLTYIANDIISGIPREGYLEKVIKGAQLFKAHQEWFQELKSWSIKNKN